MNKKEDIYGAKCLKVNIPGAKELNNLEIAQLISKYSGLELNFELVDFQKLELVLLWKDLK